MSKYRMGKSQTFLQSMFCTNLFQYGITYGTVIESALNRDLIILLFLLLLQEKQILPTEVSVSSDKVSCCVPNLGWALYNMQTPEEIAPKTLA